MPTEDSKAFTQGQEAGRVAQILVEHGRHFDQINGSMEKNANAIFDLASEIRGVREDMRIAAERVEVAASTLATETERRREELAGVIGNEDRKFTKRERIFGAITTVSLAILGYFLGK